MTSTVRPGEETHSLAEQTKERAQDTAREVKGQTREKVRSQLSDRSTELGDQATSAARAMHQASSQLRQEGNERSAAIIDAAADRGQRLGEYLRNADGDRLLRDVEGFGRRQPWLVVSGSVVLGFLGSRFVKASSHSRYQSSGVSESSPGAGRGPAPREFTSQSDYPTRIPAAGLAVESGPGE